MSSVNKRSLKGMQVLVIDDDDDSRALLVFVLEAAGAVVIAVNCVEAAKTSFVACLPQLVISDLAMPGLTGYDLLQWVRSFSAGGGRKVPVVALTAMASSLDRQEALEAGFDAHCSKPIDLDEFVVLLEGLLQLSPLESREKV